MSYDIAVSVTVAIMAFIMAYISTKFNKDQFGSAGLQILFLGTSILLMVLDAGYLIDIADAGGNVNLASLLGSTLWWVMLTFFFVFVGTIMFIFIYSVMKASNVAKKEKKEKMYLLSD